MIYKEKIISDVKDIWCKRHLHIKREIIYQQMAVSLHFISHCKVEFKDFLWILLHISEKISYG